MHRFSRRATGNMGNTQTGDIGNTSQAAMRPSSLGAYRVGQLVPAIPARVGCGQLGATSAGFQRQGIGKRACRPPLLAPFRLVETVGPPGELGWFARLKRGRPVSFHPVEM